MSLKTEEPPQGETSILLTAAVAAGFDTTNPVIAGVLDNIAAKYNEKTCPKVHKKVNPYMCEICKCEMSSALVYETHINGAKHKKKVQAAELTKVLKDSTPENKVDESSKTYECQLCNLTTNSPLQLKTHLEGAKHKRKETSLKTEQLETSTSGEPKPKYFKTVDNVMKCELCQVEVRSPSQMQQHELSRKHKIKVKYMNQLPNGRITRPVGFRSRFNGNLRGHILGGGMPRGIMNPPNGAMKLGGMPVGIGRGVVMRKSGPPPFRAAMGPPRTFGAGPRGPPPLPVPPPRPFVPNGGSKWLQHTKWVPGGFFAPRNNAAFQSFGR